MRRPFDAQFSEIVETDGDRAIALTEGRVQIHAQACDSRQFDRVRRAGRKRRQSLLGGCRLASQELAFGSVQLQWEDEVTPALPRIVRQLCCTCDEIVEGRSVGRRSLSALTCYQVELS